MTDGPANRQQCPIPRELGERITLNYGEGGRLTRRMIRDRILSRFPHEQLHSLPDAAHLPSIGGKLAFSTDGHVVTPLFFPGGDIGRLAIFGTVNDLAVSGARPLWISLAMIVEEGLPWTTLDAILDSIQAAAEECSVQIVTGDTKVVPHGAADGIFLTTAGVGEILDNPPPGPGSIQEGDLLICSGPIGRHGIAVLAARNDFGFMPAPTSDCAPLCRPLNEMQQQGIQAVAIRDATRGGLTAVLHEWAEACDRTLSFYENQLPITADVRAICELLGLDPWHLANEGTFLAAFRPDVAAQALDFLQNFPQTSQACVIGEVVKRTLAPVTITRASGRLMPLDEPAGAPLPRIC